MPCLSRRTTAEAADGSSPEDTSHSSPFSLLSTSLIPPRSSSRTLLQKGSTFYTTLLSLSLVHEPYPPLLSFWLFSITKKRQRLADFRWDLQTMRSA
ncbi:hypothetical protein ElyMa_006022100 [Elysia marginata]|uniref:Uncharacterized protein n=1 Tax=Elysia marginata TaxID=1093978 RepID=A0AAV4GJL4_9GAST|nr:hypothetical protein ElyMa_006022100 [Elysia marginata]